MRFEFDPAKAASNLKKHGVSIADAEALFEDPLSWVLLGMAVSLAAIPRTGVADAGPEESEAAA